MLARIELPKTARSGEVIRVRIAIQHPMETGFRFDISGHAIPKNVINNLVCRYSGVEVFRAEMGSGIAANPLLQFFTVVRESGEFDFEWSDDSGARGNAKAAITVAG